MTALTVSPPSNPISSPHGPELSGPLKSWLFAERADHVAIDTIRKSPILSDEARRVMPALRDEALKPATEAQIRDIVGQRFALFPQPQRTDGEWAAWWADYFDALNGLTAPAIEAGMAAWVRSADAEFMCKPGKLRGLASTVPNDNRWAKAYYRAEKATYVAPLPAPEPSPSQDARPSADEVRAMVNQTLAALTEKDTFARFRNQPIRTPQAQVDERGMSAEMREVMRQRAA